MLTGLHAGSYRNMQLGAGVFLKDLDPDLAASAGQLRRQIEQAVIEQKGSLGATMDGGKFQCVPKMRTLGADGQRGPTRGSVVIDGWTVTLSGTMVECTPENFAMTLGAADIEQDGLRTTVRARSRLTEDDYIPRLCWAGNTSKGLVLIELTDVLSISGVTFAFGDDREGSLPFCMQAHCACPGGQDDAPCRIIFFAEEETT